jgi:lysophospholipase L1-like esterase
MMVYRPLSKWLTSAIFYCAVTLLLCFASRAQTNLRCGPFTQDGLAAPEARGASAAVQRFASIKGWVKTQPYRVLFLGDSLIERFDPVVWHEHMEPRGVFNAGISGDRTEHLRWRLEHGNLDGPPPTAVVVLIGTNDLTNGGQGRPPEVAAEGIRANLLYLRQRLPAARILLLGLWPREESPDARLRRATVAVNQLIQKCGEDGAVAKGTVANGSVTYADVGGVLLASDGRLTPEISPDRLHFTGLGYARLAPRLDALIDDLAAAR